MAIGERIRFFRNLRGMTQKYLGMLLGFQENTADIRIAQYEAESRTPKKETLEAIASTLDVSPYALNVPDIDTYSGLIQTLFVLEDLDGLTVERRGDEVILRFDSLRGMSAAIISEMITSWAVFSEKYQSGEISKDDYDHWRYHYSKYGDLPILRKTNPRSDPNKEMRDAVLKRFKEKRRKENPPEKMPH
ncbi:MAG: helix-turn-helix transcriptional regulator [Firmicutes bacterium]|nr:helix-turn-helix transcriptional regulator [Bacillota bacterium]